MTFLAFCGDHPFLALFMLGSAYYLLRCIVVRGLRTINVALRGWPPAHLDADGDWKPEPEKESAE